MDRVVVRALDCTYAASVAATDAGVAYPASTLPSDAFVTYPARLAVCAATVS